MKKKYLGTSILGILFVIYTILVLTNQLNFFDNAIYNFIFSHRNKYLDFYFMNITKFGNTIVIIMLVLLLVLLLPKKFKKNLVIETIITVLINNILKYLIKRPRPNHLRLIKQGGYSYPSGHAMISIAVYGYLIYIINKNIKDRLLKLFLTIILLIITISIGLSRIYLGVHYPTDIVGGYFLTIIILLIFTTITNKQLGGLKNDKNDSN